MDKNPFPNLKISNFTVLDDLENRSTCPKCGKSRKYFCYTCYVPVRGLENKIPNIQLPLKVDIIKHPSERDGKSTAVHAAVIAPHDVTIYSYPCIPDYDKDQVVVVFPGETSTTLDELAKNYTTENILDCSREEAAKHTGREDVCDGNSEEASKHTGREDVSDGSGEEAPKHTGREDVCDGNSKKTPKHTTREDVCDGSREEAPKHTVRENIFDGSREETSKHAVQENACDGSSKETPKYTVQENVSDGNREENSEHAVQKNVCNGNSKTNPKDIGQKSNMHETKCTSFQPSLEGSLCCYSDTGPGGTNSQQTLADKANERQLDLRKKIVDMSVEVTFCNSNSLKRKLHDGCPPGKVIGECHSVKKKKENLRSPFSKVVFIDSTWNQTTRISEDERLYGLRRIELKSETSKFWRIQEGNPRTFLSTIEAVYYFMRDYHNHFVETPYKGEYDNLLFLFCSMHQKVHQAKTHKKSSKS